MDRNRGCSVESFCKAVFFCKLPLLEASKRNLLPSRIFRLSQKPFICNINMPAAACDGVCHWSYTPSNDSSWECSRRLHEANGPPVAHSSYLLFGFPRASCRLLDKHASEGCLRSKTGLLMIEPHSPTTENVSPHISNPHTTSKYQKESGWGLRVMSWNKRHWI